MNAISVVVPVYNTEKYIDECISSILCQTLVDIEIIFVVDASPDNSVDIIKTYQENDDRIKIIEKSKNEGLSAARNSGVRVATGKYIIHLDSDDFWIDNNMLSELYEIAEHEECEILRFNGYKYENGNITSSIVNNFDMVNGAFVEHRELWSYRSVFLFVFNKDFIEANNLSFIEGTNIGEDGVFVSSAFIASEKVSSTSSHYYAYRVSDSSMMTTKWDIQQYIEEEESAQLITENISGIKTVLNSYISYRMNYYWPCKIAYKAKQDLSRLERITLYKKAKNNFLKLDMESLEWPDRLNRRAVLLYRYFVQSDYDKIDKYIQDVNLLSITSYFSRASLYIVLSRSKITALKIFKYLRKHKSILGNALFCKLNKIYQSVFSKDRTFINRESLVEYDFTLYKRKKTPGLSAMIRVKNEERNIRLCIESIINIFDELVIIDNDSADSTYEIISNLKNDKNHGAKIKILSYPHAVSRCGAEHSATPEDSVHSLVYYYNWCLSHCSYSVVCKWDADMILSSSTRDKLLFKAYLACFMGGKSWSLGRLPVQTIYYDNDEVPYISNDEVNSEIRVFPNHPNIYFEKSPLWEALKPLLFMPIAEYEGVYVYEIKNVADNEFTNWSSTSFYNDRKVREYRNFMKVKSGLHKNEPRLFTRLGRL